MNRDVDDDVTTQGKARADLYSRDGTLIRNMSNVTQTMSRSAKKVIRTGGPFKGITQKPYVNGSYVLNEVQGSIQIEGSGGTYTRYTGVTNLSVNTDDGLMAVSAEAFYKGAGTSQPYTRNGAFPPLVNPDLLSQAEVKALNSLRERSGEAQVDFGLWWGERQETAELFEQAAHGLSNLAKAIATKNWAGSANVLRDVFSVTGVSTVKEAARNARLERMLKRQFGPRNVANSANRTLKSMEDAALTYNLGVAPLIKDLQQAHITLQTGDLTSKIAVKGHGRYSRVIQDRDDTQFETTLRQSTYAETHGYTVTLVATPRSDMLALLSRAGLTNPANLAYQLANKSFVIDYVLALGPFLKSLDVPASFEFNTGSHSQRVVRIITVRTRHSSGQVASGSSVLDYFQREVYTNFPVPIPPLSFRNKDLSFRQALNSGLLALKSLRTTLGILAHPTRTFTLPGLP